MDAQPHTHDPQVRLSFRYPWESQRVVYGDTTAQVRFSHRGVTPKKVEKALRRAIKKHDAGSIQAGKVQEVLKTVESTWGKVIG